MFFAVVRSYISRDWNEMETGRVVTLIEAEDKTYLEEDDEDDLVDEVDEEESAS